MKKPSRAAVLACVLALASPLLLAWLPSGGGGGFLASAFAGLTPEYLAALSASFRQLAVTLVATAAFAASIAVGLGYLSIFAPSAGRMISSLLEAVESVPSILIALFCYAPVSGYLARHAEASSATVSLIVFILAATATTLPEAVRCVTIPLGELYYRKYSLSFRSYGFRKSRILRILMRTRAMRGAISRAIAGILLKTLVLDTSFGFIIQLGFGSYGTPAHLSPGSLIAANRDALFPGGNPALFWLPALAIAAISLGLVLALGERKESLE
jgi:hypothetical protein